MSSERSAVWAFGRWLALVAGILLAGCTPDICGRSSDCASGLVCTTIGACVVPPVDASTDDGTTASIDAESTTTIGDADGDALGVEPIDAAPIDAAPAADADTIDAPPDNVGTGNFEGVW
jgi:uncharacterized protein (DUF1684 family)